MAAIAKLYEQQADALPNCNEAQTEQHWIRPVLEARQAATPELGKVPWMATLRPLLAEIAATDRLIDRAVSSCTG